MPAVVRDLLDSPLGRRWRMQAIATYRGPGLARQARVFPAALVRLAGWCLGRGPRLVHIHAAVRGSFYRKAVCVAVARAARRPIVFHVHAGGPDIADFDARLGPRRRAVFRQCLKRVDRVLSVSRAGAAELERCFDARDILVVPNAAPTIERPPPPPDRTPDRTGVLYLGGFDDPAKGGAVLVAALDALLLAAPGVRVTLAGPGTEPAALASLRAREPSVRWAGWLDGSAKQTAFAEADVVVFPSVSEGLPVALLEAMAYGRAIVATRVGGMPEVLADGEDGCLVAPEDPGALAGALGALVADPAQRLRLGAAARASAQRLNADAVVGPLEAVYEELLGSPGERVAR